MDTTQRALSALAGTGIAFALGAGMAVAASGVFTNPDPVLVAPTSGAVHSGAAEVGAGFVDATDPNVPSPPSARELSPTSTPAPYEVPRQLGQPGQPSTPDLIPIEDPVVSVPPPPVAESGHDRDCRSARNGSDAMNCQCEQRGHGEQGDSVQGPDHDDAHHRDDARGHRHHDCR